MDGCPSGLKKTNMNFYHAAAICMYLHVHQRDSQGFNEKLRRLHVHVLQ